MNKIKDWEGYMWARMIDLHVSPLDHIELRIRVQNAGMMSTVRRALRAFVTGLSLLPTSIAVHPSVAVRLASHQFTAELFSDGNEQAQQTREYLVSQLGPLEQREIPVEPDDSLDARTVAIRLKPLQVEDVVASLERTDGR